MTLVEFRETTFDKALSAVKESKHHAKSLKQALNDLEDALCEYYNAELDGEEYNDDNYREHINDENNWDDEDDMKYRNRSMRMRNGSNGMSSMRYKMRSRMNRGRYDY